MKSTLISHNWCLLWHSLVKKWKWNEELSVYAARSCEDELSWGGRRVQDDNILSMHLESHIGLFSAPLYDFNGKALWEHAAQEKKSDEMRWVVIGGEWMFSFLFSLLAFSLVYFVGLVSQWSHIYPCEIQIKKLATRGHSDKKNKKTFLKCKLVGSPTVL